MSKIKFKKFYVKPKLPEQLKPLIELSENLWSTWDSDAYKLFSRIEPVQFREQEHNPVKLLQVISETRMQELAEDKGFLHEMHSVYNKFKSYVSEDKRYFSDMKEQKNNVIAYFSMEYGLHESLPIYSGGLGVLSGDHLKGASDMGLPLIGFGLHYNYGYFSQKIDYNGNQKEIYKQNNWNSKPIEHLKDEEGNPLEFSIKLRNQEIFMSAWKIRVGKISLYMIDTNLAKNPDKFRSITDYLYVADREMRLLQEIILAYGGLELIRILDIKPKIFHMNEGHSAFIILKRLKNLIEQDLTLEQAQEIIAASAVFTSHTPVPAGNEKFDRDLVKYYLEDKIKGLGLSCEEFFRYGKVGDDNYFWLPALAMRFSRYVNAVSKLHREVSQKMWHKLYPNLLRKEVPIKAITNGVHMQSWLSRNNVSLFDRYLGPDYLLKSSKKKIWHNIYEIPAIEIWEQHQQRKEQMIGFIRNRFRKTMLHKAYHSPNTPDLSNILNPNSLIIGFARRFATYKRANLILKDPKRLLRIINHKTRPVQFIFAGKAHPADDNGKAMIKQLIDFAKDNNIEDRFVFIEDYDINVASHIVQGVDVWLNNPIKPLEASGTSGMKAGMNGALNISVLDGWWPECYNGANGWSIEAGENIDDVEIRDKMDANEIYDTIENRIAKLYYDKNKYGIPTGWIQKMKKSMHDVAKGFNMHRMLTEYCDKGYLPGLNKIAELSQNEYKKLDEVLENKRIIKENWEKVNFKEYKINLEEREVINSGKTVKLELKIDIADIPEEILIAEIFYEYQPERYRIIALDFEKKEENIAHYRAEFNIQGAGEQDYNIRIRPLFESNEMYDYLKWLF